MLLYSFPQDAERSQKYQLQSLANQILAIDDKLEELGAVRSPYDGSVYRLKVLKQNDITLSAEIILEVS